jgi:hypothetical protein
LVVAGRRTQPHSGQKPEGPERGSYDVRLSATAVVDDHDGGAGHSSG